MKRNSSLFLFFLLTPAYLQSTEIDYPAFLQSTEIDYTKALMGNRDPFLIDAIKPIQSLEFLETAPWLPENTFSTEVLSYSFEPFEEFLDEPIKAIIPIQDREDLGPQRIKELPIKGKNSSSSESKPSPYPLGQLFQCLEGCNNQWFCEGSLYKHLKERHPKKRLKTNYLKKFSCCSRMKSGPSCISLIARHCLLKKCRKPKQAAMLKYLEKKVGHPITMTTREKLTSKDLS
jgi:hypothetical protein